MSGRVEPLRDEFMLWQRRNWSRSNDASENFGNKKEKSGRSN